MPPMYPTGLAGAGLLVLRFSVASSLAAMNLPFNSAADLRQVIALLFATALGIGVHTRAVAALSLIWAVGLLANGTAAPVLALLHAVIALALALTGPGAYSVDGRLFGRRRVKLPGRSDTSE